MSVGVVAAQRFLIPLAIVQIGAGQPATNMIEIAKACFEDHLVPTEHREITLTEFRASALGSNAYEKARTKK